MTLRCRFGLHQWGRWQRTREVTTHRVITDWGRQPDQDYTTSRDIQVRQCIRCGLERTRRA